jgi:cellulose synthase (UDP-forming)
MPILTDVSQVLGAWPICRAAVTGLLRPRGHPFTVTAKDGDRSRIVVQWALMRSFLLLFGLTLAALLIGIFSDRFAYNDSGDGKVVVLFWTLYNLAVLALTIVVCIELPRSERHVADAPVRALMLVDEEEIPVWVSDLTTTQARLRGEQLPVGTEFTLRLAGVGDVAANVEGHSAGAMTIRHRSSEAGHVALLRRLYSQGGAPGPTRTRLTALLNNLGRRLVR